VSGLYNERLSGIVETPVLPKGYSSSYAQYTIKLKVKQQRDGLQAWLKERGIPSAVYYSKPLHEQSAFADLAIDRQDLETSSELSETVLSLPMHPYLEAADIDAVCRSIRDYIHLFR